MVSSTVGSSTRTGWKRRSRAASFSMCLRYSSRVVAPIMCSSPRASMGLSMLPASMAPSAAPAPTTVWSSSMNRRIRPSTRLDLVQHGLEAFLELAPVLGPGDQGAHVEGEDRLVAQALGDVAPDDPLGQALDDGGLADPRVADQDRVVLGLAGQDLDHPADLGVAADHRVELAGAGVGDQVAPVLGQGLVGDLRHRRGDPLVAADPGQGGQELVAGQPLLLEAPPGRGGRPLLDQRQHQVLDRHVLVLEPSGLPLGGVEQPGQPLGDHHLPRGGPRSGHPGPTAQVAPPLPCGGRPGRPRLPPAAVAPGRRAGRAGPAAGARHRPRCGRSAAPWSGRRAALPGTSGSDG